MSKSNGSNDRVGAALLQEEAAAEEPAAETSTTHVRACGAPATLSAASLGFNLLAGETYAGNILPIVQTRCISCHAPANGVDAAQQNSTTCGYLDTHLDNVIARMRNNLVAQACDAASRQAVVDFEAGTPADNSAFAEPECYDLVYAAGVPANPGDPMAVPPVPATAANADRLSDNDVRNYAANGDIDDDDTNIELRPMPQYQNNDSRKITQAEIDVFVAWNDVAGRCEDSSTADEPLPTIDVHTDDDELNAKAAKLFEGETCQDGPSVVGDRVFVEAILALPEGSESAFYDYENKTFVEGARKMDGSCSIDYFIQALAVVPGAAEVLQQYKDYGWWATQCAIVDGRPQAYLAHVAKVTTALGDTTYGAFLKLLKVTDQ